MWTSTTFSTIVFLFVGLLAAYAYPNIETDNILNILSRPEVNSITKLCVFLFSFGTLAPSVAIRSLVIKLNVEQDVIGNLKKMENPSMSIKIAKKLTCNKYFATFWSVISPYLISFFFYEGRGFAHFINWTALAINGSVCFLAPFLVYLKLKKRKVKLSNTEDKKKFERLPRSLPFCRINSKVPEYLSKIFIVIILIMILTQISINLFYLFFTKKDYILA